MITKEITFTDYNGQERKEKYQFNFTKAELTEMELSVNGGLSAMMERIKETDDRPELMRIFKDLILKAYGVKSADGKRFVKSEELRTEFSQTEAYSELYMELVTNTDSAINFFNGLIPNDLKDKNSKVIPMSASAE